MATDVQVMPATKAMAERLAPRLRASDRAELAALGLKPAAHLRNALRDSKAAYAVFLGGELCALAGVSPNGCAWALTSRGVERHKRAFLRASREVLGLLFEMHPGPLWNWIDARYGGALRWAQWLGFSVGKPKSLRPHRRPFRQISLTREAWAH